MPTIQHQYTRQLERRCQLASDINAALILIILKVLGSWVYKHIFVADGNFKADHIWQKNVTGDIWLSEGGGMIPKLDDYLKFLASAIERLTVC